MSSRAIEFLLKKSLKTNLLFYLKKFEKKSEEELEGLEEEIYRIKDAEVNASELIQKSVLKDGKVILPAAVKDRFALFRETSAFPKLFETEGWPLVSRFQIFRAILRVSPLHAGLLEDSQLAESALNHFPKSEFRQEFLQKLTSGDAGGVIGLDFSKADQIEEISGEDSGFCGIKGGLPNFPLANHDLFPENFYLYPMENEEGKCLFFVVNSGSEEKNGIFSLGMLEVDGSDFYVGNLLFGHPDSCKARKGETFSLREKHLRNLENFSFLQSSNTAIACAEISLEQATRVFFTLAENSEDRLLAESTELMKSESMLIALQSILFSAAFYSDLCENPENPEKEYSQKILKILTLLSGSYCISEAEKIFYRSESFAAGTYGPVFRNFATLRSLLRNAALRNETSKKCQTKLLALIAGEEQEKCFDAWFQEMHQLEKEILGLSTARESAIHWRESVGGLMLLLEHFREKMNQGEEEILLQTDLFIRYLGDVAGAYFCLKVIASAEKEIREAGADPNEPEEADEELRFYYRQILNAEYFCLRILKRNEGATEMVLRNCPAPLSLFAGPVD